MSYPELRFPEFREPWAQAHAGDAFEHSKAKGEAGLPIWSVTLDRGLVPRRSLERHMGADAADESNLRAQPGDLVYNMMRMWQGAVGMASEECMVSPAYVVLSPKTGIVSRFFDHWCKNKRMLYLLWAYSHGLTEDRLRLYFDDFARIPLALPGEDEQKKIADVLDAASRKNTLLTEKKSALEEYKRGVMQRLFNGELRFSRDDGSDFPDWEERRLGDVAKRSTSKNSDMVLSRVLTNSATQGVIDQGDYFDKDIANAANIGGYYVVRRGDFVYNPRISVSAPVGPIKRNNLGDGVMSPLYTVFSLNAGDTDFFAQFFETSVWHRYMHSVANFGARHDRMAITTGDFMAMPVPFPHFDEQRKIANFLAAIDAKIDAVSSQIAEMETFKKGLLQKMFV